jgi:5-methylcytosine-specific restriction protein A
VITNNLQIPKLDFTIKSRNYDREFKKYSSNLKSDVVMEWLSLGTTHRNIDRKVLGLNPLSSKGFQSMGVLHYLGLKKEFSGFFKGYDKQQISDILKNDEQDFSNIIQILSISEDNDLKLSDLIINEEVEFKKSSKDISQNRLSRINKSNTNPERLKVYSFTYKRNPDIVAEALYRAKGICEQCFEPAPFLRASDNSPYLEVHHKISLSNGGEDTLDNVIAICPNCHRKIHHG